jgi:hypothetical protein
MKTRTLFTAIVALIAATLFTSCEKIKGKGEVITEQRTTGTYSGISLAMSATVHFIPGTSYSLEIHGQENVLREIITQVEGNNLSIYVRSHVTLGSHDPISVYITAPDVSYLDISGSGDIFIDAPWSASNVSMNISGSGAVSANDVMADHLTATISGSGSVRASSGKVLREDLNISGSGTIDLRTVQCTSVYTITSGSGATYIHATDLLDATISGSGNVWYYGNPGVNTHISGSGNVKQI